MLNPLVPAVSSFCRIQLVRYPLRCDNAHCSEWSFTKSGGHDGCNERSNYFQSAEGSALLRHLFILLSFLSSFLWGVLKPCMDRWAPPSHGSTQRNYEHETATDYGFETGAYLQLRQVSCTRNRKYVSALRAPGNSLFLTFLLLLSFLFSVFLALHSSPGKRASSLLQKERT